MESVVFHRVSNNTTISLAYAKVSAYPIILLHTWVWSTDSNYKIRDRKKWYTTASWVSADFRNNVLVTDYRPKCRARPINHDLRRWGRSLDVELLQEIWRVYMLLPSLLLWFGGGMIRPIGSAATNWRFGDVRAQSSPGSANSSWFVRRASTPEIASGQVIVGRSFTYHFFVENSQYLMYIFAFGIKTSQNKCEVQKTQN